MAEISELRNATVSLSAPPRVDRETHRHPKESNIPVLAASSFRMGVNFPLARVMVGILKRMLTSLYGLLLDCQAVWCIAKWSKITNWLYELADGWDLAAGITIYWIKGPWEEWISKDLSSFHVLDVQMIVIGFKENEEGRDYREC